MKTKLLILAATVGVAFSSHLQAAPPGSGWTLTYDTEFNKMPTIASTVSTPTPGMLPCDSWNSRFYNDEQEYYCFPGIDTGYNPFSISTGSEGVSVLNITANKAPASMSTGGQPYVSGFLSTGAGSAYAGEVQSSTAFGQQYGYFEVRAKMPTHQGQGYWPAFWLMPYNAADPSNEGSQVEYDIFEVIGNAPTVINQTVHWNNYANVSTTAYNGPDTSTGFHTYGFQWDAANIKWYVDGVLTKTAPNQYNSPMYVLLNMAMGGSWPGNPNASTVMGGAFQIEYLRVYAATSSSTAVATQTGTTAQSLSNFPAALNLSTTASPYTLTANTSAGLPVTYTVASGPATVSGNILTITGAGTVVLNAAQAGSATYAPLSATETIIVTAPVVQLLAQTIANFPTTKSLSTSASSVTLPVTTSAGLTIGYTVVSGPATISGTTLTLNGAGTVVLQANQAGNSTYAALSATETITVTASSPVALQTQTLPSFAATANYATTDSPVLPATTSAGLTVTYSVVSGPGVVSSRWLTLMNVGTIVVQATQAGNSTYAPFTATETVTVTAPGTFQTQTLAGFAATATMSLGTPTVTLPPLTSSGFVVAYSVVSGPATVVGNTLTLTGVGKVVVQASQAGDADNAPFTANETITVTAAVATKVPAIGTFRHHRK